MPKGEKIGGPVVIIGDNKPVGIGLLNWSAKYWGASGTPGPPVPASLYIFIGQNDETTDR